MYAIRSYYVFTLMQEIGQIAERDMYNTFNMGIGMVLAVEPDLASDVISSLEALGEKAYIIGEVTKGNAEVEIC